MCFFRKKGKSGNLEVIIEEFEINVNFVFYWKDIWEFLFVYLGFLES